mmetsp:Transcript_9148/g.25744  ORF Transcript_9148/g.25744 Transcript_9148/m.25744 type:complete len:81 (-) Transcript_9148:190-432(-)
MSSTDPKCGHRRDKRVETLPKIRRMGMDGLQIDEDMTESAAKATDRRRINDINNDDGGGGDSADRQEVQARHIQVGRLRT